MNLKYLFRIFRTRLAWIVACGLAFGALGKPVSSAALGRLLEKLNQLYDAGLARNQGADAQSLARVLGVVTNAR